MSDHERADIQGRTIAVRRIAEMEQQHLPPVDASNAQEFARLMQRDPHRRGEPPRNEEEKRTLPWDRFKQSAFRFASRILSPEVFSRGARRFDDRSVWKDLPDGARQKSLADADDAAPITGRGLLMRLGASLFRDRAASDLSHDLAECVRHADFFGQNWQLEVRLSCQQLPATRLRIVCDDGGLRLHFSCGDARAFSILQNNRMLLLTRIGAVSTRPVAVDIEEVAVVSGVSGAAGGKA